MVHGPRPDCAAAWPNWSMDLWAMLDHQLVFLGWHSLTQLQRALSAQYITSKGLLEIGMSSVNWTPLRESNGLVYLSGQNKYRTQNNVGGPIVVDTPTLQVQWPVQVLIDPLNNIFLIFHSILGQQSSYKRQAIDVENNPPDHHEKHEPNLHKTWRNMLKLFQGGKALPHPP